MGQVQRYHSGLHLALKFQVLKLIYFRVTFMEIVFSIFILFQFLSLFDSPFILLNLYVVVCLYYDYERAYYSYREPTLVRISMSVLYAFCCHFNAILINFYCLLLLASLLRFAALLSRIFQKHVIWILLQIQLTHCHVMRDRDQGNPGRDY